MSESPADKRRWHRFSLRTIFVVVTVLCCLLGFELNWLRHRHELLGQVFDGDGDPSRPRWAKHGIVGAPGGLWLFGEQGVEYLILSPTYEQVFDGNSFSEFERTAQPELNRAKRLFPEAIVTINGYPH